MKIKILKDYNELSYTVADIVQEQIERKPNSRIILPTGSTPIGVYKELVERKLDWSQVKTFNLDEYVMNSYPEHSYLNFMIENLFDHTNLLSKNCYFPDTWLHETPYGYDVDLCLLGIGGNGHIAFNEPGSSFDSLTRMVELSEETVKDNSRFFPSIDDVPTQAVTMGLKPIMSSKRIIIMANGKHKKDILDKAMNGEVTEDVPASILQRHENVEVFYCD